jgi:hypothetical protein
VIAEALVIFACVNSTGCSETSNAYYKSHPEIEQIVKKNERRIKEFVGPVIVQSSAPFFFVVSGGTGNFKLYGNFSLQIKNYETTMLIFSKGF